LRNAPRGSRVIFADILDDALYALDDLLVLEQFTAAGGGATRFHGFNKPHVVLQHPVHGFLYKLGFISAGARGNFSKTSLFIRW
jgi:hypothetical protein